MFVKYIIKVFLYLVLAVMTLIHWFLKIPMMLGNILLYFLSIIFILTGVLSYGFALESARECGRMIMIGMAFGAIPDFVPFLGKSLEILNEKVDMKEGCERLSFLFVAVKWQDNNVIYTVYYVQILYLCMMGE